MTAHDINNGSDVRTHEQALRVFFSKRTPRTIAKIAAGSWAARLFLGPPGLRDVAAAATAIAIWPFQEWVMHKYLLHVEPRTIAGVRIDPDFARAHRDHHADPRDIDGTLLPTKVVHLAGPVAAGLWLLAFGPTRTAVTGMATYSTMPRSTSGPISSCTRTSSRRRPTANACAAITASTTSATRATGSRLRSRSSTVCSAPRPIRRRSRARPPRWTSTASAPPIEPSPNICVRLRAAASASDAHRCHLPLRRAQRTRSRSSVWSCYIACVRSQTILPDTI